MGTKQIWAIESVNNGKYVHIRNFAQNKCLDNKGKSGINLLYRVWACDNKTEDQWFLLEAPKKAKQLYPNGYFNIIGKTGLCVAARNNNSNLVQVNCGNVEDLLWKVEKLEDGLKITNKNKRQMDAMGARVYGYVKQNVNRQVWAIESVNNGKHVTFRNYIQNKCLDDKSKDQWFLLEAPKKLDLPKGWINIVSHSGLCVASRLKNGDLTQQNCGDRDNLLWKVEEYKNGFVIENATKRVMYNSGNNMLGYVRNNSWQSIWSIESVMHGKYITFRNIHRKTYCLDDYGKHVKNNKFRTFACSNENKNQWFLLQTPEQTQKLSPDGYFNIIGKSGLCVSSRLKNSNLQQEKCGYLDTLLWTVEKNGDGLILINKTKRVMDNSGATVRGYIKQKTTRQIWAIESVKNGKYVHIRNFAKNKCLDDLENLVLTIYTESGLVITKTMTNGSYLKHLKKLNNFTLMDISILSEKQDYVLQLETIIQISYK